MKYFVVTILAVCMLGRTDALEVGASAPDLGVTSVINQPKGLTIEVSKLKGRVVVIDFWATWCGPCITAIPHIQKLHDSYAKKGLVVIGHTDKSSSGLEKFVTDKKITYVISVGKDIGTAYGVNGIPHVYVIGVDGKVVWHGHPAGLDDGIVEKALTKVNLTALSGKAGPSIDLKTRSSIRKVSAEIKKIKSGRIGYALKALEKMATSGEDAEQVDAKAVLEEVTTWMEKSKETIEKQLAEGDAFGAREAAKGIKKMLSGHLSAGDFEALDKSSYKHQAYKIGSEWSKLVDRFEKSSDKVIRDKCAAFIKKYTAGFYVTQAQERLDSL